MATVTKTYSMTSDIDGLTGVAGSADTTCTWDSGNGNPSGSLDTLTTTRNQNDDSYYYEDTTWQGLGVPAGATVTDCRLNAGYYYQGLTDWVQVDSVTPGPFEIRTQDDITTIATLWSGTTETSQGSGWTSIGAQSDQSIGASYQASSTNIRVRFGHNIDLGNNASAAADLHLDELQLVITYSAATTYQDALTDGSKLGESFTEYGALGDTLTDGSKLGETFTSNLIEAPDTTPFPPHYMRRTNTLLRM